MDANSTYFYRVTAYGAGGGSFPVSVTSSTLPGRLVFRRGDADDDGRVNIADAIWILVYLLRGGDAPPCPDAADVDDSGSINVGDPIGLLNYLFCHRTIPPCPGPLTDGLDPTRDDLPCR